MFQCYTIFTFLAPWILFSWPQLYLELYIEKNERQQVFNNLMLPMYHDEEEYISEENNAAKYKAMYWSLFNTTTCELWQYWITHLKLACSPGPTSKYPECSKWGKILRWASPSNKENSITFSQLTQNCYLGSIVFTLDDFISHKMLLPNWLSIDHVPQISSAIFLSLAAPIIIVADVPVALTCLALHGMVASCCTKSNIPKDSVSAILSCLDGLSIHDGCSCYNIEKSWDLQATYVTDITNAMDTEETEKDITDMCNMVSKCYAKDGTSE